MAQEPSPGLTLENVKIALQKCLSLVESERKQAYEYLTECENNSEFVLMLLQCFLNPNITDFNTKLQSLIYLKNTITRKWSTSPNRHLFKSNITMIGGNAKFEEAKSKVREIVLSLIQQTYGTQMDRQIIEILAGISKHDFPAKWEALAEYILKGLEAAKIQILAENTGKDVISSISPGLYTNLQKFILIYKTVIREQAKKKMQPTKANFYKLAKPYMEATYSIIGLFDNALQKILNSTFTSTGLYMENFDQNMMKIGHALDKNLLRVASCGFNPSDSLTQPEQNMIEIQLISKYIEKLEYYLKTLSIIFQISQQKPESAELLRAPSQLIQKFARGIFDRISEMQFSEPVIMYNSLEKYSQITMQYLSACVQANFSENLQRACLLAFHRVLNTVVYNENDVKSITGSSKYSGIVASPVKFRNFETFILKARSAFNNFFNPANIVNLFDLIVSNYLPIKSISLWETDPETFIEQEDDTFTHEFESDRESSISYLSYSILEQLLSHFPVVCAKQVKKYVENLTSGKMTSYNILLQDAVYNAIEMLPKIYALKLKTEISPLKANSFLSYLEKDIISQTIPIHSHILKRRYIILVMKWLEFIPTNEILPYLGNIVKIMCETDQLVLKFHCCMAVRNILSFLEGSHLKRRDYDESDLSVPKENQIIMAELRNIEKQINYAELLTSSARVIIDVLNSFKTPKLVWAMINLLTLLIEKCQYNCNEGIIPILEATNFASLFSIPQELIQEALIDMAKALVLSFPASPAMIKLSFHIIDIRLTVFFEYLKYKKRKI